MVVALGVLMVTSLLLGAVYVAVDGSVQQSQRDLNGQRAYYNARAGENAFLYQLNQNPNYWSTCSNDYQPTATTVPGTSTGGMYSYVPVYNSGYSNSNCTSTNAISAMIDPSTGTLRMEFTGYAGPNNKSGVPSVQRTLVASFRKPSPLDFLWYTDHEMEDPQLNSACKGEKYYYQYSSPSQAPCPIYWVSGDTMSGPSYTNDQYLINTGASPTFGRSGSTDQTESSAPTSTVCVSNNCQKAKFNGDGAVAGAEPVPLPQSVSSTQLLADANANDGAGDSVFTGTTTITLSGAGATITNCPGTTSSAACNSTWTNTTVTSLPPIIYVQSGSSCPSTYAASTYATNSKGYYYGACGDVYVHGTYSQPLTIVSDHDIIVMANMSGLTNPGITTSVDGSGNPTGGATLGLVAGDFVRVMHASGVTPTAVTIDAAILTLAHSFIVDNWSTDTASTTPKLTIHGAIAQRYRGAVGTTAGAGYVKDYHYDDRLKVLLPPYLFSLSTAGWEVSRETLCTPNGGTSNSVSCQYQGS